MMKNRGSRKIVEIDERLCDGCGLCITSCAEGALKLIDGKARLISDHYCDGLGACLGECPQGAIRIIEREADEFDQEAANAQLAKDLRHEPSLINPCGCPSSQTRQFKSAETLQEEKGCKEMESALTHWPIQIRLVPPFAPFLQNADLLIVADCVPFAYPSIHQDFMKNRVVMVGCPKFDDIHASKQKLIEIFQTAGIRSVTVLSMEVPCCSGIQMATAQAVQESGNSIPLDRIIISLQGEILERRRLQEDAKK